MLVAIGQEADLGFLGGIEGLEVTAAGSIEAAPATMRSGLDGVFAGGEVVSGPASVIEAIGRTG